jgi:hypothetical protein
VYTFDCPVRQLDVASTLDAVTTPGHVHHVRAQIGGELSQALLTPADRSVTFLVGGATFGRLAAVLLGFLGVAALIAYRVIQRRSSRSREDHEDKQEHRGH